jgi:ABC-type lipoprotein export system ATPase subunit
MNKAIGSIWHKADFHVHTPFSALENHFGTDFDNYVQRLFKTAIEKNIHIIGITDYFTIEGYKKIKEEYLGKSDVMRTLFTPAEIEKIQRILLLPNIEFRLNKIIQINRYKDGKLTSTENGRVNMHIIFSNEVPIAKIEENFLHELKFIYESDVEENDKFRSLKVSNLTDLGTRLKKEQPGFKGSELQIGMTNAVVDDKKINDILVANNDFKDKYLIVIPADEDLSHIAWTSQEHHTRKILLSRSHAFFSANPNTIEFGLGNKSSSPEEFLNEFKSLKPCLWGSDAHGFDNLFEPDRGRYCWIKSDPTFEGVRQILFEPAERTFIGDQPELFKRILAARGNYLRSIKIQAVQEYKGTKGKWFSDFHLDLGLELCVIIGNKGKGKSALADIIALLGNAHVAKKDFSFLNPEKFCQKGYAENFVGTLKWFDNSDNTKRLSETVDFTGVERVKYIPQAYLEKLCNDEETKFKDEINKVVFNRLDDADKLGRKSFEDLESYSAELINQQIELEIAKLALINKNILQLEDKTKQEYRTGLDNNRNAKLKELENLRVEKNKLTVVPNPETDPNLTTEQKTKLEAIGRLAVDTLNLEKEIATIQDNLRAEKILFTELNGLIQELAYQKQLIDTWKAEKGTLFKKHGIDIDRTIAITINTKALEEKRNLLIISIQNNEKLISQTPVPKETLETSLLIKLAALMADSAKISNDLEKPFREYQEYLQKIKVFESKEKEITGDAITFGSLMFYNTEISYLDTKLQQDITTEVEKRTAAISEIFGLKKKIQAIYNKMKGAISGVLEEYTVGQNITIETSFKVDKLFATKFFDYVNRYGDFYQNGDENLKTLLAKYDINDIDGIIGLITELFNSRIHYKEGRKADFYNFISSLEYIRPEYDLRLNRKSLNQLSPGEKGGLLLVFYLVLDKDNKPLIIDQPEDNLDNQSVAEILVPYIKRAKKLRQIIMVTHNPNLAIVSDAEQVIFMDIDKENDYTISIASGAIENRSINNHIVNILEGKMKAFDNRRIKYRKFVNPA